MRILGIESSCDDTAIAIVDDKKNIIAHNFNSQIADHKNFGGVVPEIASRAHMDKCDKLIIKTLKDAGINNINELDAIAVTQGPGLIGGLLIGLVTAKALVSVAKIPLIGINHLEAHALTVRLTDNIEFPYLLLLISGGHCQFVAVNNIQDYKILGSTIDDAAGEAFDKVAKMLNLDYPGGPIIEQRALLGDENKYKFPKPLYRTKNCNFSFSGLKTAVKRQIEKLSPAQKQDDKVINDICASFQKTVAAIMEDRIKNAFSIYEKNFIVKNKQFVIAGGVAANQYLRSSLLRICAQYDYKFFSPPINLCTDNGAMIAWAGIERLRLNITSKLDISPIARWPIDDPRLNDLNC